VSVPLLQRIPQGRLRRAIRALALDGLSAASEFTGQTRQNLNRPRIHFLYSHGVHTEETAAFQRLIEQLQLRNKFVSYSEAVERVMRNDIDSQYVCFSFDDGFASCVTAAELLTDAGISACFFVCPDLVGKERADLKRAFPRGYKSDQRTMTWHEIEGLLERGHEVGSHTLSHPVLAELCDNEAAAQIHVSRETLSSRFGDISHFAWPRGQFRHFNAEAADVVRQAGYSSCASAERGCHTFGVRIGGFPCFRRDYVDLSWPLRHTQYLIARSARRSSASDNEWPKGWDVSHQGAS